MVTASLVMAAGIPRRGLDARPPRVSAPVFGDLSPGSQGVWRGREASGAQLDGASVAHIAGSALRLTADRRVVLCGYGMSTASSERAICTRG
jgi:hypothetical protein